MDEQIREDLEKIEKLVNRLVENLGYSKGRYAEEIKKIVGMLKTIN